MYESIFMESTEEKGILLSKYEKLFDLTINYINDIEVLQKTVKQGNYKDYKDEIIKLIEDYKAGIKFEKKPEPIEIGTVNKVRNRLKARKRDCEKILNKLIKLKKGFRFGISYFDGILLNRSKMLAKNVDEREYGIANDNFRLVNYAMDWAEKVMMDLYNLVDQDLNLITIIERMYTKTRVYENTSIENRKQQILFESPYNFGIDDVSQICKNQFEILMENKEADKEDEIEKKKSDYVPVYVLIQTAEEEAIKGKNLRDEDKPGVEFNKFINKLSKGDHHYHTGLSFDDSFKEIQSYHAFTSTGGGIHKEIIGDKDWFGNVYVAVQFIEKDTVERMKKIVKDFFNKDSETHYHWAQYARIFLHSPRNSDLNFVCSTFVAHLLWRADPKLINKPFGAIRPEECTLLPRSFYVKHIKEPGEYKEGSAENKEIKQITKELYNKHIDQIMDYNNQLPKVMLKEEIKKANSFDKLMNVLIKKVIAGG